MTKTGSVMHSLESYLSNKSTVTALDLEMYHFKCTGKKTMSAARIIRFSKGVLIHPEGSWETSSAQRRFMRYYRK